MVVCVDQYAQVLAELELVVRRAQACAQRRRVADADFDPVQLIQTAQDEEMTIEA